MAANKLLIKPVGEEEDGNNDEKYTLRRWYRSWFFKQMEENRRERGVLQSMWENKFRALIFVLLYAEVTRLVILSTHQLKTYREVVFFGVLGVYKADVVLGLFHMFGDCYPMKVERIQKGKFLDRLSFGFHVHHAHKTDWCEYNIFYRGILVAGLNAGVAIHLLYRITETVCYCFRRYFWVGAVQPMSTDTEQSTTLSLLSPATIWTWQAFLLAATVSQVTHAASHDRWGKDTVVGQVYRRVEGILVASRDAHKLHHTSYNCNYCITTGWGNPIVNWVFRTFVQLRLDPNLQSEVSQKVYGNGLKNGLVEPYYELFPEWRETQ